MTNVTYFLGVLVLVFYSAACSGYTSMIEERNLAAWTEVRAENFNLLIPQELVAEDVVGFDGYAARFSSTSMTVFIESRAGSETVSDLKRESRTIDLKEERVERDAMKGIRVDYRFKPGETNYQDQNKEFVSLLSIDCKWSSESVSFMVLYQNSSDADTANKVLNSVRVACSD